MKIHILEREYDLKNNIIKILYNSDGTRKYKIGPYPNTISLTGNEKNVSELFEWIRGIYKPGHLSENQFKDCYNIEEMTEDILILNMVSIIIENIREWDMFLETDINLREFIAKNIYIAA